MATPARKNVSLCTEELEIVSRVRREGTAEHAAIFEVLGKSLSPMASEAESLRAILKVGIATIEEKVMDHGYAAMAAERDEEDRVFAQAMRQRTLERSTRD